MQRPIDAKEAIEELMSDSCYECWWGSDNPMSCDCDYCTYREAIRMAINALTDAEPVRCKDCKYYIADGCDECALMSAKSIIASINNKRWHSDFYCAWGERREDET